MAKQDIKKPTYVNLLPNYGYGMPDEIKMPPYKQYLHQTSTIGLPFISFDFYPIMKSGIRETWYSCLEDIYKSLEFCPLYASLRLPTAFLGVTTSADLL